MMSCATPNLTRMLVEYRDELTWARARLEPLPPAYAKAILAVITTCTNAVDAIEQAADQASTFGDRIPRRMAPAA